tara:strand:- start:473 stop:592 length:120 start_codon:yes stop_codon:yes gene_type:complete
MDAMKIIDFHIHETLLCILPAFVIANEQNDVQKLNQSIQ